MSKSKLDKKIIQLPGTAQDELAEVTPSNLEPKAPEYREDPLLKLTYEDHCAIIEANKIVMPNNMIMIPSPLIEKRTRSGIYKPDEAITQSEHNAALKAFHPIIALGRLPDNVSTLSVGDKIWMKSSVTMERVGVDVRSVPAVAKKIGLEDKDESNISYLCIDYYGVAAVQRKGGDNESSL